MRAPRVARDQFSVLDLAVQIVVVAEIVRAELDLRRARASLNARQIGNTDRHLSHAETAAGQLRGFGFLVADAQFGGEGVRPLRVQLGVPGRQALVLQILAGFQRQTRHGGGAAVDEGRGRRTVVRRAGRFLEGHGQTVIGVDVPVDLGEVLLVLDRRGHADERTWVVIVAGARGVTEGSDGAGRDARNRVGEAAVNRTFVQRELRFELLVRREEEQRVLDDRAAQRGAPGLFVKHAVIGLARAEAVAAGTIAPVTIAQHAVVGLLVEGRTREGVGARLGHRIDRTADEAVVDHAERRHGDVQGLNGVDGDRRTLGRIAVAVQTELVVLADAVDGELVLAGVRAGEGQGVFIGRVERDERIQASDILGITADRGSGGDVARPIVRASAVTEIVLEALTSDGDRFQLSRSLADGSPASAARRAS